MTLKFTMEAEGRLRLAMQYLRKSNLLQRQRSRSRWVLPIIMLLYAGIQQLQHQLTLDNAPLYIIYSAAWWFLFPVYFDSTLKATARKQLAEPGSLRMLGPCELRLLDEHLESTTPLGTTTCPWSSIEQVYMDAEYLYVVLASSGGFPILIAEIGQETAQQAHAFVTERIGASHHA